MNGANRAAQKAVGRRDAGFLIRSSCELRVEGAERPGVVADWLMLTLPREGFELNGAGR